ncbi:hypothetical protein TPHA_0I00610 [Tetrapisispora phaffii CBS 4417]|uniref:AMP-dependent synthetase/ligase domain-containing protein n=1 Tax=Tetrapisispora phaffii (strain ATCC 24235 / CBS 4417 / NBRC 1672 / NRRL Y-8282 / UCD 70-5) TaxID=1071381 RepID=G8BXD9_TETPH|nr:hypothetical protein TPHA_0I00610 [Tetrapisispora phaffii CBS 4417]CCE64567.1 hypothetical protein TPHA_0I00610 [Tetrapisispora phaffii CBS 4417]
MYSVEIDKPANEHETAIRRNVDAKNGLVTIPVGMKCTTVYEFAVERFNQIANKDAMGWRDVIEIHEEEKIIVKKVDGKDTEVKKTWNYFELSGYKYNKYSELLTIFETLGKGLLKIGLRSSIDDTIEADKIHIYASTSHKWMKIFLAAQSQNLPVVTAYDTLGEKGLIHSMKQTNSKAMFTDNALLKSLVNPLAEATNLKYLIYSDTIDPNDKRFGGKLYNEANEALEELKKIRPDVQFYSFDEIMEFGSNIPNDTTEFEFIRPKPEDLSCIMYTSGSTGDPKGVVLKHKTVIASLGGCGVNTAFVGETDRIIAFLPLAHIFELTFELLVFLWGATIGYANVKTLTTASVRNCQGDLQEFKPTVMVAVAAVWESVKKGILQQVSNLPFITQKIFWGAYKAKSTMNNYHIPGGNALGNLVFKKIKQATGGNLRFVLNGGSPVSLETQTFITNLICPMLIGYGLTETNASGAILRPKNFELGVTGDIVCGIEVKLVDVEELGYFAKKNQGELWIRGDPVTPEYYKNPEETKNAFTEDGWFKTGDIAEFTPKGFLNIIDRKKNLVKTLNGEYIALEKLESIYRSNQYVANICVYADITKVKPIAIIVPNLPPLTTLAKKLGILKGNEDIESYLNNKQLVKAAYDDIIKTGRAAGLVGIEMLQGIVFFDGEWTPQNGFVTSAQKLKRKLILETVQKQVDKVYASSS